MHATEKAEQSRGEEEELLAAKEAVAVAQAHLKQIQAETNSNSSGRVRPPRPQKNQSTKSNDCGATRDPHRESSTATDLISWCPKHDQSRLTHLPAAVVLLAPRHGPTAPRYLARPTPRQVVTLLPCLVDRRPVLQARRVIAKPTHEPPRHRCRGSDSAGLCDSECV
ncbi:hypothetical protein DFH07DRAFT_952614 [Mycena maculata]|uniref:Uncharacterized protein n=1 Tax=Mycena maculata TaxID=230809 RepID=A0AAD7JX57_9AGAR|nr:hypothetical protein DFH07DRAFT_952614 [Mycena maculata]